MQNKVTVTCHYVFRCEEVKKIWLLCSLSGAHERARWEDVSESASVQVRGKRLVFETKVQFLVPYIKIPRLVCTRLVHLTVGVGLVLAHHCQHGLRSGHHDVHGKLALQGTLGVALHRQANSLPQRTVPTCMVLLTTRAVQQL